MHYPLSICLVAGVLILGCKTSSKHKDATVPEVIANTTTETAAATTSTSTTTTTTPTTSNTSSGTTSSSDSTATLKTCSQTISCNQPLPDFGKKTGFAKLSNQAVVLADLKGGVHRGRDIMIKEGEDPNIVVKFAYNILFDKDIKGEKVDVYMSKSCTEDWVKLGTGITSEDVENPGSLDGVVDTGGYVMFPLSKAGVTNLPVGRHRFVFVLQANHDYTELFVDVLPASGSGVIVTDIDGTLTAAENATATEISGTSPAAYAEAVNVLKEFDKRGYHIFYLTARPAFLTTSTRNWLTQRGFPAGTVRTTPYISGLVDNEAATFKANEIELLKKRTGLTPAFAFGNKPSDVKAYSKTGITGGASYFYKISTSSADETTSNGYGNLEGVFDSVPSVCP